MARDHARIYVRIQDDTDWLSLTMAEQWAYQALLISRDLSWCGVAPLLPQRVSALAKDATSPKVLRALAGLEAKRFVLLDHDTAEIAVRTFVRHDGVMKQPNVLCAAIKAWGKVHSEPIREAIRDEFRRAYVDGFPEGFGEGFTRAFAKSFADGFPEGFANSPSPFPLPPSMSAKSQGSNVEYLPPGLVDALTIGGASR